MEQIKVRKTTFEEEQKHKEDYFLSLDPIRRLEIAEETNRRIWSNMYESGYTYEGKRVTKKVMK